MELIFLAPVFKEKIWGGNKLKTKLNMDIPNDKTGEAWIISAYPGGVSKIKSPEKFKDMGLDQLYKEHREIFGKDTDEVFPLLIKLLDASDNLSVQVHPDNEYARKNHGENELGKTECWYIVDADEDASIIYGHNAKNKEEFLKFINEGRWGELLKKVKVKKGDFFDVPYGTIHAIGKGIVILETQQSSDITYRLYDYDRKDADGKMRDLHIEDSINVSKIPFEDASPKIQVKNIGENSITKFLENEYFSVYKYSCKDSMEVSTKDSYYLMTVIEGRGRVKSGNYTYNIKTADSFIVPFENDRITIEGNLEIIASRPNRNNHK